MQPDITDFALLDINVNRVTFVALTLAQISMAVNAIVLTLITTLELQEGSTSMPVLSALRSSRLP